MKRRRRQSGLDCERGLNLHIPNGLACASPAAVFASLLVSIPSSYGFLVSLLAICSRSGHLNNHSH